MATRKGLVKKTLLSAYGKIRSTGIIAINMEEDDGLVSVLISDGEQDLLLATSGGKAIRFSESDVRTVGRNSKGVTGIRMPKEDYVIALTKVADRATLLVVSEQGFGKRTQISDYNRQYRGGKGVFSLKTGGRNGDMIAAVQVLDDDQVMVVTNFGRLVRLRMSEISVIGRNTKGVTLIPCPDKKERVIAVGRMPEHDDDDDDTVMMDGDEGDEDQIQGELDLDD